MKRYTLILLPLLLCMVGCSRPKTITQTVTHVRGGFHGNTPWYMDMQATCLITDNDSIWFVRADTTEERKPVFILLQGSTPMPLITTYEEQRWTGHLHILGSTIIRDFHVIEIAMPNTPWITDYRTLDVQNAYTPTGQNFDYDETYRRRNHLDTYVSRANDVVNYISKQAWADSIVVFGHSQGAYIAAALAEKNSHVAAVGFSATSPFGRVQGQIQSERMKVIGGYQTEEQAAAAIARQYDYFAYCSVTDDEEYMKHYSGDMPRTILSFSQPVVEMLSHLRQPLFVAYGTRDFHSLGCEVLPIYFSLSGKHNYRMCPMAGRGHNYELIRADGSPDWNDMKWHEVTRLFGEFVRGAGSGFASCD